MNIKGPITPVGGSRFARVFSVEPKVHGPGSKLWQAFNNPLVPERGATQFLRQFVIEKGIRSGTIVEFGPGINCVLPNIPSFKLIAAGLDKKELEVTRMISPFVSTHLINMADLPMRPILKESVNIAVWNCSMLYFLKACAHELSVNWEKHAAGDMVKDTMTLKALSGLHKVLAPGGYFIEFHPFKDVLEVPIMLKHLGLKIGDIEYFKRGPEGLSAAEMNYLETKYLTGRHRKAELLDHFLSLCEKERCDSPFTVMVIKK